MRRPVSGAVATLTFHWAANYGAVLQAYALQKAIAELGHTTFVLNYVPLRLVAGEWLQRVRGRDWRGATRAVRIHSFAYQHLQMKPRVPRSGLGAISRASANCAAVVTGSDQVWNEWFVMHGPRGSNLAYYLACMPEHVRRVAYAVSFGSARFSGEAEALVRPELSKFAAIGARESTGQSLLQEWGFESTVLADPTLLHGRGLYEEIAARPLAGADRVLIYLLHAGQQGSRAVAQRFIGRHLRGARVVQESAPLAVGRWLANIRDARFVVTNSFHVVSFCLIFHTPFVVLPVSGSLSGMNDRFATLLGTCGLLDRIVSPDELEARGELVHGYMDWRAVDRALDELRSSSWQFLADEIGGPCERKA